MREYLPEDGLSAAMDDHPFRTATDPGEFRDIYLAAAQAVERMPKPRQLEISFDLQVDAGMGQGEHEFSYAQGATESWYQESSVDSKVGWGMFPTVEMDDQVPKAWKKVGEVKGATIELYLSEQNEHYINYRLIH